MFRFPCRAAALAATLAVAACAGHPPGEDHDRVTPPHTGPSDRATAAVPAAATTATHAPRIREAAARDETPAAERAPLPEPATLGGLAGDEIQRLLGMPAFARSDPPAALWQYRRDGCLLDLYLYPGKGGYRVRHFEFRADPGTGSVEAGVDARRCYAALLRARTGTAAR